MLFLFQENILIYRLAGIFLFVGMNLPLHTVSEPMELDEMNPGVDGQE